MTNADLSRYYSARTSITTIIDHAARCGKGTQNEILEKCHQFIDMIYDKNKRTPKHLGDSLRSYLDGYIDAAFKGEHVFLYKVDGMFYKTEKDKDLDSPLWSSLPKDSWDKLGDCGGIYWRKTLNPFFVR